MTVTKTVRVREAMNEHGAMTVEDTEQHSTHCIVGYLTEDVKETLGELPEGTALPLEMESVRARGDLWRAVSISPRAARPVQSSGHERPPLTY